MRAGALRANAGWPRRPGHPIRSFVEEPEDRWERTRYELEYTNQGRPLRAVLFLGYDGNLVLENRRDVIWRRAPSSAAPATATAGSPSRAADRDGG